VAPVSGCVSEVEDVAADWDTVGCAIRLEELDLDAVVCAIWAYGGGNGEGEGGVGKGHFI
jgi:hypothetical protein